MVPLIDFKHLFVYFCKNGRNCGVETEQSTSDQKVAGLVPALPTCVKVSLVLLVKVGTSVRQQSCCQLLELN